jgi:hypothetical protein
MGLLISRNPLIVPHPDQTGGGTGTGTGLQSFGSNLGEFGATDLACYRSGVNTGPFAVFDTGLGRNVQMSDLTADPTTTFGTQTYFRRIFTAGRFVLTGDPTFQQCILYGQPTMAAQQNTGNGPMFAGSHFPTFIDCLIDGQGVPGGSTAPFPTGYGYDQMTPVGGSLGSFTGLHMERCEVRGMIDILKQVSNCYVGYSWLHDFTHFYDKNGNNTHCDHVQINGSASNATYEFNTMGTPKSIAQAAETDWTQYETLGSSGLFQIATNNTASTLSDVTFRVNYFNEGDDGMNGSIGLSGANLQYVSVVNTLMTGNRCGPHQRFAAINPKLKSAASDGSTINFDGSNVYDDNFVSFWGTTYTKGQVFA